MISRWTVRRKRLLSGVVAPAACALAAHLAPATASANPAESDERLGSLVQLAVRHEHAEGVARDYARAHDLYCEAGRAGHGDALVRLGWMYANGRGVPRDDATAHGLFRRAGELGNDLGLRLAAAIRGDGERLPDCLTRSGEPSADTLQAERNGPTPDLGAPAEFRPSPTAASHRELVATVVRMAREFRLDPRLVFALIRVESNFDPLARSPKNAQGLMQLIPETAERFGVADVWNPVDNLRGGMSYLRWLLSYYQGDVVLTLAAYNAGEGAVDRHRGVPPFAETLAYVQRLRSLYPLDRHAFDPRIAAPQKVASTR